MLDLYFGTQTKRIRVAQLGIVLPAIEPDPGRRGRRDAGPDDRWARLHRFISRVQRRWVDVTVQQTHGSTARCCIRTTRSTRRTAPPPSKRRLQIIKKAWTEPMLSYGRKYWKDPGGENALYARYAVESVA